VETVERLTGGASSLSYLARVVATGRPLVVKVAPAGLEPVRNRDVLRQARLLDRLHGSAVPVPGVVWQDLGEPPTIPPLFVMEFVAGTSLEPLFDRDGTDPVEQVGERFHDAARAMARLHAVDPMVIGLGDEPVVELDEEIDRWSRALSTVDPSIAPDWAEVRDALAARTPTPIGPAIVHGDFRLGNLLAEESTVQAIIDWEIWSIGDPRVDLGWFLINADPATYRRATPYVGRTPDVGALLDTYRDDAGRDITDVDWFQALACFKATATWSLIVKHNRRRDQPDADVETMATTLPGLLDRAGALLGS
jgi:aminoglycoside phosphotransferase (APT) family kinase protein